MLNKIIMVSLLVISLTILNAEIEINSSSATHLNITYNQDSYELRQLEKDKEEFQQIIASGIGSLPAGAPDLPTRAIWFAIPRGTKPVIRITAEKPLSIETEVILPVPEPAAEIKGSRKIKIKKDASIYNLNSFYPAKQAALEKNSNFRGQPCAVLRFFPFQYNPVSSILQIYESITVDISFNGTAESLPENVNINSLKRKLSRFAVNAEEIIGNENRQRTGSTYYRSEGCELLVFYPDEFAEAAQMFKSWKERKGITTDIIPVSICGSNSYEIRTYLEHYCENSQTVPEYIMLFGDSEHIPPWYLHIDPYSELMLGTDLYYGDLEIEFDYLQDFAVGRVSVDTPEQASLYVNKLINYELDPPEDPGFYQTALLAGAFQDGASEELPDTYANRRFAKTSEDIRNYLYETGYDPQRLYAEYNGYDDEPIYPTYWNQYYYIFENDLPGEELNWELHKPQFPWNATGLDVSTALQGGCFLLSHRDHGGRSGWGEPDFNSSDVSQLSNGDLLPVVWSINCLTGYFDNETDEPEADTGDEEECFIEQWFRNPVGGAIGAIGSTRVSYSGNNDRFVWGLMDAVWPGFLEWCGAEYPDNEPVYRMGDVINYAKNYLSLNYYSEEILLISYEEFEWFGDPTLEIWTMQPGDWEISHESSLEYNNGSLSVDTGIMGAACTLWNGEEVIARSISGINSIAVLEPVFTEYTPELLLTVSYEQKRPYTSVISVSLPAEGYLELDSLILNDETGNMNDQADYGESISLGLEVINIGQEALTDFDISLTCSNEYITVNDGEYSYSGSIVPQENTLMENIFQITVSNNCPDGVSVPLLFISDQFVMTGEILLNAPQLSTGHFSIEDESGNNNGAADPGETVEILIPVFNRGEAGIEDVTVMLLSNDQNFTISPEELHIDTLFHQGSVLGFTGIISAEAEIATDYELHVFVSSGGYNYNHLMSGEYGIAIEDFESGDFTLFDWQMNGTHNWIIDDESVSGNYSARTDLMGMNNWAELSVSGFLPEPSTISFYRKLYADTFLPGNNGGLLYFFIDEEETGRWEGNISWYQVEFEVEDGPHTFRWIFEKDSDPTLGHDGAWIDRIEFPNMTPPPPPEMILETDEINMVLESGESGEASFYLMNSGGGTIDYFINFQEQNRNLDDTRITINTCEYYPDQTTGWLVNLENNSSDNEAVTDLDLTFPESVTVNIITSLFSDSGGEMVSNDSTGSGVTVNWHGESGTGQGYLLPGESAQGAVNITTAYDIPFSISLSAQITGNLGSVIEQEISLGNITNGWVTLSHNNGNLIYEQEDEIVLSFTTSDLIPGNYQQVLEIKDGLGNQVSLPVNLEVTSLNSGQGKLPAITEISRIYPNPFNPRTTISFSLKKQETVNLSVYNIRGQLVSTLLSEKLAAGNYDVVWEADKHTSGIYFLKMQTESHKDHQKLLLLK